MTGINAHVHMERPEIGEFVEFQGQRASVAAWHDDDSVDLIDSQDWTDLRPGSHGNFAVAMLDLDGEEQVRYFRTLPAALAFASSQHDATVEGLMD